LLIPDSIPIEKDNGAGGLTGRWKKVSAQPARRYGQRYPAGVLFVIAGYVTFQRANFIKSGFEGYSTAKFEVLD